VAKAISFLTARLRRFTNLFGVAVFTLLPAITAHAQETKPPAPSKPTPAETNPAQIELLETKYRFETNGDSRKEVHTRVKINSELGVRQFARLNFDFNRSFQSVEIPLVRITHPSGGVADILPSAITDNPNPAVVDFPAYHDVRVKSVRILGLQPGDLLEYRVITTTAHHPLAPDFWLDHTFDRSGVVTREIFVLELPLFDKAQVRTNPTTPAISIDKPGESEPGVTYSWDLGTAKPAANTDGSPDVVISTFRDWEHLSERLGQIFFPIPQKLDIVGTYEELSKRAEEEKDAQRSNEVHKKAAVLTQGSQADADKLRAIYDFVSQKIKTVDLPLGATGFRTRQAEEILASGYATPEDKYLLMHALVPAGFYPVRAGFTGSISSLSTRLPAPFWLRHILTVTEQGCADIKDGKRSIQTTHCTIAHWLDSAVEVAPFDVLPQTLRGAEVLIAPHTDRTFWLTPIDPPFAGQQNVHVAGALSPDGKLVARVRYTLRGDNELLLRVAFHQTPKEKWKDIAQLLAISDGFRGDIKNVTASDPYATKEPFTVEYEIEQPKFVDWSKKTVRIPALLPSPGLPDVTPSTKATVVANSATKIIDLGTPLEIELDATVTLPEGTTALAPTGTSVERDYATFSSKYSAKGNTIRATRKLHFISQELPATRAGDLNAFLHAVQADQAQLFTLQPPPQK